MLPQSKCVWATQMYSVWWQHSRGTLVLLIWIPTSESKFEFDVSRRRLRLFFPCELHSAVEQCRCSGPGVEMSKPLTRAGTLWDVQSFKTWRIKRLHTLSTDVACYVQKHHSIQAEQQKRHQENKFHLCLSDDDISRLDTTLRTDTSFRGINVWLVSA